MSSMKSKPKKEVEINKEVLLAELDLHKTEFSSLRQEILQLLDAERQYLYLSLVAFGAGLGLTPFIANQDAYTILLFFPLVFHVLLWEMLKSTESIGHIAIYFVTKLTPRVNKILSLLGRSDDNMNALGWEEYVHTKPIKISRLVALSFMPSRHWVPILSVGALLVVYALTIQSSNHNPSRGELGLVAVNLLLLVWAGIYNVYLARDFNRTIKKKLL
jgi:hypothetical protein